MCLRVRVRACVRVCAGGSGEGSGERIKCGDIKKGEKTTKKQQRRLWKKERRVQPLFYLCVDLFYSIFNALSTANKKHKHKTHTHQMSPPVMKELGLMNGDASRSVVHIFQGRSVSQRFQF